MSKLKTVWDAINELRGDLSNTYMFNTDDAYLFYWNRDSDYVCSHYRAESNNEHQYICNIAEFNALVEEMTLGLDVNPVNHGHYLNYVDADKTLLEKENKSLVYTQEMADNGELPSVGSEVLYYVSYKPAVSDDNHKHHGEIMDVVCHNGGLVVLLSKDKLFATACNDQWVRPIDQSTKKEKAIDEFMAENLKGGIEFKHLISKAYDKWVGE